MSLSRSTILPADTTRRSTALLSSLEPRKSASALSNRNGWLQHFFSSVMMFSRLIWAPPFVPYIHPAIAFNMCPGPQRLSHCIVNGLKES